MDGGNGAIAVSSLLPLLGLEIDLRQGLEGLDRSPGIAEGVILINNIQIGINGLGVITRFAIDTGLFALQGKEAEAIRVLLADGIGPVKVGQGLVILLPLQTDISQFVHGIGHAILIGILFKAQQGVVKGRCRLC